MELSERELGAMVSAFGAVNPPFRTRSLGEPGANLNYARRERQARREKVHEPHAPTACRSPERQLLWKDEINRFATITVRFGLKMTPNGHPPGHGVASV